MSKYKTRAAFAIVNIGECEAQGKKKKIESSKLQRDFLPKADI